MMDADPAMTVAPRIYSKYITNMETSPDEGRTGLPLGTGTFHLSKLSISADRILRLQGYRDLPRVRRQIRSAAEEMATLAAELSEAQVHYRVAAVSAFDGCRLRTDDHTVLECEAFGRYLLGSSQVIALVATLGTRLDDVVIGMIERFEPLEALLLETAGWLAIELTTKAFHDHVYRELLPPGHRLSPRMAPGYSYRLAGKEVAWPLEQQRELFGLLDSGDLPVTLLDSCAMKPKMSRSGLYGVLPSSRAVDRRNGDRPGASESHSTTSRHLM